MKIRNGFVSNSSSSSFIILVTEKQYNEIYENCDVKQKYLLDELGAQSKTAFGLKLKEISGASGDYSVFDNICFSDEEDEDLDPYDVWESIPWPEDKFYSNIDA